MARGQRSQREFAEILGVDRTTVSRYESERLGLPPDLLSRCLEEVANLAEEERTPTTGDPIAGLASRLSGVLEDLRRLSGRPNTAVGRKNTP